MFLEVPELVACTRDTSGVILEFKQNINADSYRIYRKTLYTNWTLLETVTGTEHTTYTDANVIEGTEYIYTVKAVNGSSSSPFNETGVSC